MNRRTLSHSAQHAFIMTSPRAARTFLASTALFLTATAASAVAQTPAGAPPKKMSHTPVRSQPVASGEAKNDGAKSTDGRTAPLLQNLGDYHFTVTTKSKLAQRYFDQGLILSYGFNHAEAVRAFREVARLDPDCAMAYWGVAISLGPNVNAGMEEDKVPEAYTALRKAQELAPKVSEKERAFITALAARYGPAPVKDRKPLDVAYAAAMRDLVRRYPSDPDALTLFAESLMDTTPWNYWTKTGEAKPETKEVLEALERVLASHPQHPGANHLYIHAIEASPTPERGLPSADRLRYLAPASGHLVHMPSHIYVRVGRYREAILANERAIAADDDYVSQCHAQGLYPLAYVPHNHHFVWYAATLSGRSELALSTARHMAEQTDQKKMREPGYGTLQHYWLMPLYTLVRFGRWEEILNEPAPAQDMLYPRAVWHYARGVALARKKRLNEAEREAKALAGIVANPALKDIAIWSINSTLDTLRVAESSLAGEIALESGDLVGAERHLKEAIVGEDSLTYDEPPAWAFPCRPALGSLLLMQGRAEEAEKVYQEDLKRLPENGWSLFGLLQSLRMRGDSRAATAVQKHLSEAWRDADVTLTGSRF